MGDEIEIEPSVPDRGMWLLQLYLEALRREPPPDHDSRPELDLGGRPIRYDT